MRSKVIATGVLRKGIGFFFVGLKRILLNLLKARLLFFNPKSNGWVFCFLSAIVPEFSF